ncbi:MAG: hypothetical protein JWO56_1891 [Acidobacteria bacterium]|nr:hypothetical protein [Acidobacteriota bacterium]
MASFLLMMVLLRARYVPLPDTNPEYGQGAIERNDLAHREVERFVWLIQVDDPADPAAWQERLNEAVDPRHGSFAVECATADDERDVAGGRVTFQR